MVLDIILANTERLYQLFKTPVVVLNNSLGFLAIKDAFRASKELTSLIYQAVVRGCAQ